MEHTGDLPAEPRAHEESVRVAATPEQLYVLVSDVTRTGEWSPVCQTCWWDDGDEPGPDGPRVGARFTGRNVLPERTWETRSRVVAAEPGREFAWEVGDGYVRWGYRMEPAGQPGITLLTESWEFTDAGLAYFAERFGEKAPAAIEARTQQALAGIPATLAALQRIAES
ncbi:SRPBCC family protein [Zhihengliuella flava]|uniref:SRPBCC family protein n=1 Tax=Zhihengliuella flava TaxID=1285193 RepID=A0A931GEW5_9MICC|nr:SRPBCC family protein [Zhihengliuella flava]MBG6084575.1 hypothetical protein [Zhihengliuella flava]